MELKFRNSVSTVKPESVEIGKTTVFLRKDIQKEERMDSFGDTTTVWTYQQAKMSPDEFVTYASLLSSKDIVNGITVNNQLIIMDAIADLYDKISKIQGGVS